MGLCNPAFTFQYISITTEERTLYTMKKNQNKWVCAAIPALLLHCSIGTVYCWSIFSQEIADYIGFSKGATEWAFSFAIFFLDLFRGRYGGYRIFHLLRRTASGKSSCTDRYLYLLWLYYGYRSGNRIFIPGQDSYALV